MEDKKYTLEDFVDIVAALRSENGCPWDKEQTHESLEKCLRDECEEVIEAIENKDDDNLCEELGDVLLQVVMHSQIAKEEGRFTLEDVIDGVAKKMVRRHPHVFAGIKLETEEDRLAMWNAIKEQEKQEKILKNKQKSNEINEKS
mgnify:CR=1 FL=1